MKKYMINVTILMAFLVSCGSDTSGNNESLLSEIPVSSILSLDENSENNESLVSEAAISTPVSNSISTTDNISINDSSVGEIPLYPSNEYFYDFSTFNQVVNYTSGTENFSKEGYDWSLSSYQNQGSKFYLGSNGKFGNDELFGLTEENGFINLLTPSGYDENDVTYGMKMEFDIVNVNTFILSWNNRSAEVDVTVLYSTDSGETWTIGVNEAFTGMIPEPGSYVLGGSITLSQVFVTRVRFAIVLKAISLTDDGGSTLNLNSVLIS